MLGRVDGCRGASTWEMEMIRLGRALTASVETNTNASEASSWTCRRVEADLVHTNVGEQQHALYLILAFCISANR